MAEGKSFRMDGDHGLAYVVGVKTEPNIYQARKTAFLHGSDGEATTRIPSCAHGATVLGC